MHRTQILIAAAAASVLAACSSTPEHVEELETARAVVPQVEASPRAGVAATNIAEARKALDRANALADKGGKLDEIQYEANVATKNAQIANEKILTVQAKDEIDKATVERQTVLTQAREREAQRQSERASVLEQELADMRARKTDRGMVLTLGDVLFDTGKSTLKPGAYSTIDRLAGVLKESEGRRVAIEGHTDSVGSEEMNLTLSERRADAVRSALIERGVRSEQIVATGKGESTPVASNDNAAGRQQNRRVEMIFTEQGSQVASEVQ
jgi:outer membrane protein OmpA-like peptidoglycan-associated protein